MRIKDNVELNSYIDCMGGINSLHPCIRAKLTSLANCRPGSIRQI